MDSSPTSSVMDQAPPPPYYSLSQPPIGDLPPAYNNAIVVDEPHQYPGAPAGYVICQLTPIDRASQPQRQLVVGAPNPTPTIPSESYACHQCLGFIVTLYINCPFGMTAWILACKSSFCSTIK